MTALALVAAPPAQLAREVIAHHSKSFALASRVLPARMRDDAAVLYAWCRRVDDTIDAAAGAPTALLAPLRDELACVYAGRATTPELAALADIVRRRCIPEAYPRALLDGMAMDLAGTRYAAVDELLVYAWRVAGVVGLMMSHVLGVADDAALVPAAHLGIAMQLTNICRDVAEDWQRGRLYIPDELLVPYRAGGLAGELGGPLPAAAVPALARAVRDLLALADRYYRSADHGIAALPWRAAIAVRSARDVYSAIGDRITAVDHDITAGRAVVPRAAKLARVALAALRVTAGAPARALRRRRYAPPTTVLELADVPSP